MALSRPYFLENKDWYVEIDTFPNENEYGNFIDYELTDKAPQKAIDSYNKFIPLLRSDKDY